MTQYMEEVASAKVNLTLRITGRRADGYHELESLVAFADYGDRLRWIPDDQPCTISLEGPFKAPLKDALQNPGDNIMYRAISLFSETFNKRPGGRIQLKKKLPIAAGLGGGSADAAAILRMLAKRFDIPLNHPELLEIALQLGADVPVCLRSRATMISGIGERMTPINPFQPIEAVLVNPGIPVSTQKVFQRLGMSKGVMTKITVTDFNLPADAAAMRQLIQSGSNDLQAAAIELAPNISRSLPAITAMPNCALARLSGSGATCFGLFYDSKNTDAAIRNLAQENPHWWVQSVLLS